MKQLLLMFLATLPFSSNAISAPLPDTLYVALGSEPIKGFDSTKGWGKYGHPLIQSTLLKRTKKLGLKGDLAVKWVLSDDKLSWRVTLRDDVMFSDGSPLTANDVAFTFLQAKQTLSTHDLSNLKAVTVISPTMVSFRLNQPDITFMDHFVSLGIVPKHLYSDQYAQHPIGSGPYAFIKWKKGESLALKRNPFYYGQKPEFESLVIVFGEEHSNFALFKTGQLQLTTLPQKYVHALPQHTKIWAVQSVDNRGIVWPLIEQQGNNIGNNVTADFAIRKAVSMAIDRKLIINQLLEGYAHPATSVSDGLPWGPTHNTLPNYDIAAAKQLLVNAGWVDSDGDGVRERDGLRAQINLYYKSGDSVREELSLTISQMVKAIGIDIQPIGTDWASIAKRMHSNPVLMGFGSHSASEVAFLYHSNFAGIDFYNSGFYKEKEVDTLINKAKSAASWESSLTFWKNAQQRASLDEPWTWLVNLDHLYAANNCLDLGDPITEPHAHGWPIVSNIDEWRWICR
ncbi:ABC transporter substrate-binding protein [Vibrio alfacsensis]|uniref:ABC transporter substrate-binding protein n=1 Tax=Vibrio alfacsensis TaxID=1074311 RepID=UPI002ADD5119|nr:ABC transporter substrate-binding protein [Vibrio alfacsensis]WQE78437.1 ABC transporter substrate-binding protein [Vibrio alfacsensis]